jgi:site-specific recombinase XerD
MFVLSGVLAIAAREHSIPRNPVVGVQLPAKRRKSPRYITHAQVATLSGPFRTKHFECSCARNESESVLIELFAYAGPRWGEAVAIRVRHLNMLRRRIRIEDNAVIVKGMYEIGTPKSGAAQEIPIPRTW